MRPPSVLVPYAGPTTQADEQDIAVYLRPESNGVLVESAMLKVLRGSDRFRELIRLVYLANIPGDFIAHRAVVHEHYATRVHFARFGASAFTEAMRRRFEEVFGTPFEGASVLGAFDALGVLGMGAEELFELWVPPEHHAVIQGQSVKRFAGRFVVNYDIPAILAKHGEHTDIFSMLLRSRIDYAEFAKLVHGIERALREHGIISATTPIGRVFHYSKGPFEQILDGLGYLYAADRSRVLLRDISFARYLLDRGWDEAQILDVVRHPIVRLATPGGRPTEVEIFEHTRDDSYPSAFEKARRIVEVVPLPPDTAVYTPR